jgi:co-chaperonin GroES (HSP10)
MPPMKMEHVHDPVQELVDAVGSLKDFELFNMQVLVAIYLRPQKTKSGIYLTDKTVEEDRYQGKVGLILKTGPSAFVDETGKWFDGETIGVGDWVVFRPSDGWALSVNGQPCRILDDLSIKARIKQPDVVW